MKIIIKDLQYFNEKLLMSGYSKTSFANELGISRAYMYSIANGRNVGAKLAKKICELLSLEFSDIFLIKILTNVSMGNETQRSVKYE